MRPTHTCAASKNYVFIAVLISVFFLLAVTGVTATVSTAYAITSTGLRYQLRTANLNTSSHTVCNAVDVDFGTCAIKAAGDVAMFATKIAPNPDTFQNSYGLAMLNCSGSGGFSMLNVYTIEPSSLTIPSLAWHWVDNKFYFWAIDTMYYVDSNWELVYIYDFYAVDGFSVFIAASTNPGELFALRADSRELHRVNKTKDETIKTYSSSDFTTIKGLSADINNPTLLFLVADGKLSSIQTSTGALSFIGTVTDGSTFTCLSIPSETASMSLSSSSSSVSESLSYSSSSVSESLSSSSSSISESLSSSSSSMSESLSSSISKSSSSASASSSKSSSSDSSLSISSSSSQSTSFSLSSSHSVSSSSTSSSHSISLSLSSSSWGSYEIAQHEALCEIYKHNKPRSWNSHHNPCDHALCPLSGVKCDGNGDVISLDLSYTDMSGYLPSEIFELTTLQHLNLAGNYLLNSSFSEFSSNWTVKCGYNCLRNMNCTPNLLDCPLVEECYNASECYTPLGCRTPNVSHPCYQCNFKERPIGVALIPNGAECNASNVPCSKSTCDGNGNCVSNYLKCADPIILYATPASTDGDPGTSIYGVNLGFTGKEPNITINDVLCDQESVMQNSTQVYCQPTAGSGVNISIEITNTNGLSTNASVFSYQGPTITSVTKCATSGGFILIEGSNFGLITGPAHVFCCIDDVKPCHPADVIVDHTKINCTLPSGTGNNHTLYLTVSSQSTFYLNYSYADPQIDLVVESKPSTSCDGSSQIRIKGENFGTDYRVIEVLVGSKQCENISVTQTSINCTVKAGVGANLKVTVKVDSLQGEYPFFSFSNPVITSVSEANTDGLEATVIQGVHFGAPKDAQRITVKIDDEYCNNVQLTDTCDITCYPPPGCGGNHTLLLEIENTQANSSFTYRRPSISYSTVVGTNGSEVTNIYGTGFGVAGTPVLVTISEKTCENTSVLSDTWIQCTPQPGVGADLALNVTVPTNCPAPCVCQIGTGTFSYRAPTIINAQLFVDETTQNLSMELIGYDFGFSEQDALVQVNSQPCTDLHVFNNTRITCVPWVLSGGTEDVIKLTVPPKSRNIVIASLSSFAPIVSYISPIETEGGQATIIGSNFGDGTSCTPVFYSINGGEQDMATWISPSSIEITFPRGNGSNHRLDIWVLGLPPTNVSFSYSAPDINDVSPSDTSGSVITISGQSFGDSTAEMSIHIGNISCTNVVITENDHQINCTVPAGTGKLKCVTICIPDPIFSSTHALCSGNNSAFSYKAPVIETISELPPTIGSTLCIHGANFGSLNPHDDKLRLVINNWPFVPLNCTHTDMCFSMPNGTGYNNLSLSIDGQSTTYNFTYQRPIVSTYTSVSTAGNLTNITGLNFGQNASFITVYIAERSCDNVLMVRAETVISCRVPPGNESNVPLKVCVNSVCNDPEAVFNYQDLAPLSCDLTVREEYTDRAEIRLGCTRDMWGISVDSFHTSNCKIEPFEYVPMAPYSFRIKEFFFNITRNSPRGVSHVQLNPESLFDYNNHTNPDASNRRKVDFGLSQPAKGITIALCLAALLAAVGACIAFLVRRRPKAMALSSLRMGDEDEESSISADTFNSQNSKYIPPEAFLLKVDPPTLNFGLSSNKMDVDVEYEQQITVMNTGEESKQFKLFAPPSYKYRLVFNPQSSAIKIGSKTTVMARIVVPLTTTIDTNITLAVIKGTTGADFATDETEHTTFPIKVESKVSTKIDPEDIVLHHQLGEGSFGIVYQGEWQGQKVAVKVLKNQRSVGVGTEKQAEFAKEVKLMETLHCPQIVTFIGAVHVKNKLSIITEFMEFGSLNSVMKKHNLDLALKWKIASDTAKGITFLHKNRIIHRDLKLDNVLIASLDPTSATCAKISDFGTTREITKVVEQESLKLTSAVGTPTYMSPEVLENGAYGFPADIFSFGVTLYSIFSGEEPYSGSEEFKSVWKVSEFIMSGKRLPIPPDTPATIASLITRCWAQEAKDRPDIETVDCELSAGPKE
ncbi:tyrosine protein kinase [Pelomyxa schiedti]|nr:tyrosine protein kinase [Pelomyxa schiedti]